MADIGAGLEGGSFFAKITGAIGGRFTMDPGAAMCAARWVGAPLVVPIHYNTWPAIEQDPEPFKAALERTTDIRVAVLRPGESVEVEGR